MPYGCSLRRTASAAMPIPIRSSERKRSRASSREIIRTQDSTRRCRIAPGGSASLDGRGAGRRAVNPAALGSSPRADNLVGEGLQNAEQARLQIRHDGGIAGRAIAALVRILDKVVKFGTGQRQTD